jgi:hypothetical protein
MKLGPVILLAVAIATASSCRSGHNRPSGISHEAENGEAALNFYAARREPFVFGADLRLPKISGNQSWYAVWLMIGELKNGKDLPSMLQVGLIRWDGSQFKAQPFIGYEHSGHSEINMTTLPGSSESGHRFQISMSQSSVELLMDGRVVKSVPRGEFFNDSMPIYLKIGAEVFAVGDSVSGRVRNVAIRVGSRDYHQARFWAAFEDRGLKFRCTGSNQWEATGEFTPSLPFRQYAPKPCQ